MARDVASTAECLRLVKQARQQFLAMWLLEKVAQRRGVAVAAGEADQRIANPHDRDWSILYRGDVLDD